MAQFQLDHEQIRNVYEDYATAQKNATARGSYDSQQAYHIYNETTDNKYPQQQHRRQQQQLLQYHHRQQQYVFSCKTTSVPRIATP